MSIKHVVSFSFKDKIDSLKDNPIALEIKNDLEALVDLIPELLFLEVGIDINRSERAADMVLISKFDSLDGLEVYRIHPEHQKIVKLIKKYCHNLRVIDYEQ